ncbi:somatostatin-1B-like [Microcaecilia unicolor]|uniref:Somatostatin-1B-like n=1 Tax=Microcaecilia unicolor TaxID=1415580 RepID=A0A6P7WU98_9AMPH|nr:somatostatin-1B-like [Microcaecilia unicolor]XP_030041807.1 somatostatin-1B-like [Microcaecilia unicolor]
MQLVASVVSILLLVCSMRAASPQEELILSSASTRELNATRKDMILKVLRRWLQNMDSSFMAAEAKVEALATESKEAVQNKVEERSNSKPLTLLPQRKSKALCRNFFWKTYTSC